MTDEEFFDALIGYDTRTGRIMREYGFTPEKLQALPPEINQTWPRQIPVVKTSYVGGRRQLIWGCWLDLLDIKHFGWKSLTKLVTFCRANNMEMPWFEEWDKHNESSLQEQARARMLLVGPQHVRS